jgi:hypothetical protein
VRPSSTSPKRPRSHSSVEWSLIWSSIPKGRRYGYCESVLQAQDRGAAWRAARNDRNHWGEAGDEEAEGWVS